MKIAIVKLSALGDIVHTMAVLQFIKKQRPDILIDWVVEASFKEILQNNPDIHQIHCVNLKQAKQQKSPILFYKELKKIKTFGQYDLVIDAQGLVKSAIVAKLLNTKKIIGFDKHCIRESIASYFYHQKINIAYDENVINRNISLVTQALGLVVSIKDIDDKAPFLYADTKHHFDCLSIDKPNIILVLGASFLAKQYPVEKYAQLIDLIDANFIVTWGNKKELMLAQQLQNLHKKVIIAPKLTLNKLKSLIGQSSLVIGGDTGPTHMAWALNIPSIMLFGATPGYRNAWQSDNNIVVESESCVDVYKIDKQDFSIKNISTQVIVQATQKLIELKTR